MFYSTLCVCVSVFEQPDSSEQYSIFLPYSIKHNEAGCFPSSAAFIYRVRKAIYVRSRCCVWAIFTGGLLAPVNVPCWTSASALKQTITKHMLLWVLVLKSQGGLILFL